MAPAIPTLLGLVMLGMGLTLRPSDLRAVASRPRIVAAGVSLQYAAMPLAGWAIGSLLGLSQELLVGLVLVGACPGGTASNVITYLARGDVALSVALTTASTVASVALTPLLTLWLVGTRVPVPATAMLWSIVWVVLLPVAAGAVANARWGHRLGRLRDAFPAVSVAAIVWIIAVIAALNRDALAGLAAPLVVAIAAHNGAGLLVGYGAGRRLGFGERAARTLAIEVGIQNSGLAVVLATQHFSPAVALPGAIFSIWHNVTGSWLAARWSRRSVAGDAL